MKDSHKNAPVRRPGSASQQFHVEHINAKGNVVSAKRIRRRKKPWTFRRVCLRVLLPIILVLTIIAGGIYMAAMRYKDYLLDQIEYIPKDENPTFINEESSVVHISEYTSETSFQPIEEEHIHNFLLIGIDSRSKKYTENGTGSLADVIMVMSVDDDEGTIKLVTIQRDCYAYVPGHSNPMKINAAMSYGGPELLVRVVQNHLRIVLDGYAYVNFYNMEKVIDAVGGIDMEVTKAEVFHEPGGLNSNLREQNNLVGDPSEKYVLSTSGMLHLNGRQAVAYSRIREVGDGVYGRTERQVKVLNELLKEYSNLSSTSKLAALDDILDMVATNVPREDVEKYAFDFLPEVRNMKIETLGIPIDGYSRQGMFSDVRANEWSIRPDWNGMIPIVQEFLYGETTDFDKVEEIPNAPKVKPSESSDEDSE
ncbi:MAG: LCP family protein [Clostridiales bacterium]|nr:LCP family protein [Clostridiales bacterium]